MPFESYLRKGLLKQQKINWHQVENQIIRAKKDLETAKVVLNEDAEWTTVMAYQAMLRVGRAYLFSKGYLPADGAQHRTVVELTGVLLGKDYFVLVGKFEQMRRRWNLFFYETDPYGSKTDAESALKNAAKLIVAIEKAIMSDHPTRKFNLGLRTTKQINS